MLSDARYLRDTDKFSFLQPQKAQFTISLSCVLYLQSSLDFVNPRVAQEDRRSNVALCLHELHLYAVDHWIDHLLALSKSLGSYAGIFDLESLQKSLERLTEMHNDLAALHSLDIYNEEEPDPTYGQRWQLLGISRAARSLLEKVLVRQQIAFPNDYESNLPHSKRVAFQCANWIDTDLPPVGCR